MNLMSSLILLFSNRRGVSMSARIVSLVMFLLCGCIAIYVAVKLPGARPFFIGVAIFDFLMILIIIVRNILKNYRGW